MQFRWTDRGLEMGYPGPWLDGHPSHTPDTVIKMIGPQGGIAWCTFMFSRLIDYEDENGKSLPPLRY